MDLSWQLKSILRFLFLIILTCSNAHSETRWNSYDEWVAKGGCWEIKDSIIYGRAYWNLCKLIYQPTLKDFVFTVRIAKIEESGSFGLLFGYDEKKDSGYIIWAYPFGGVHVIKAEGNAHSYARKGNSVFWLQGLNTRNTLRLESFGSRLHVSVNDEFMFTFTHREASSGKIGLFIGGDPRQKAMFEILDIHEK